MAGVRRAAHSDLTAILDFLEDYHTTKSNLSDIPFVRQDMSACLGYHIGMPKHVVFLYFDEAEQLRGVLMASIEPFVFNAKQKWASDTIFIATAGGAWLLKKFISWAKLYGVSRIIMGVSSGDTRCDELYNTLGLIKVGGMYSLTP